MLEINGAVSRPLQLSIEQLQSQYPAHTVSIYYQNDDRRVDAVFTGALLWDVLQTAGVEPGENLRVMARAADRFRCIVRWHEIDPTLGEFPVLVGYAQDGQPISARYGPLRLVVPGDHQGLRYLRGLATITVLNSRRGNDEPADDESDKA